MEKLLLTASSLILAIFTFFLAKYTRTLAIEAKENRKIQTEPRVIVTAIHDFTRPTIIMLSIKNIGHGLASQIHFTISKPLYKAFGINENTRQQPQLIERGPLITGIPSLGPGDSRLIDWGQLGGLLKVYGVDGIKITCNYCYGSTPLPPIECTINVESFAGTIATENPQLRTIRALERIAKSLEKASR